MQKSTAQEFFNRRHHDKYKFLIVLIFVLNLYVLHINRIPLYTVCLKVADSSQNM